jgi:hypothetical protein
LPKRLERSLEPAEDWSEAVLVLSLRPALPRSNRETLALHPAAKRAQIAPKASPERWIKENG